MNVYLFIFYIEYLEKGLRLIKYADHVQGFFIYIYKYKKVARSTFNLRSLTN